MAPPETSLPAISDYALPTPAEFPAPVPAWTLDPARAVLLVHDLQEHFLDAYGEGSALRAALLANVAEILDAARSAGVPVVYTAQPVDQPPGDRALLNDFWGPGLTRRPHRAQIADAVAPVAGDTVLDKWRYSAFARTELADLLQGNGRDQLVVVGVYAHIGCQVSACEAFMRDVQPFLVGDGVADFSRRHHDEALRWVAGRCGVVASTRTVVDAFTGRGEATRTIELTDELTGANS